MDRRQQKSRQAIFTAFARLLAQQDYSKITVQQIIDGANVGRTTFYAHFETKDALLQELGRELFDHVFANHPDAESSHDFSLSVTDARSIVAHILYHLRDNGRTIARLLTGESSEVFLRCFRQYLNDFVTVHLLNGLDSRRRSLPESFLQNHISGSFVNMVQWWFHGGMKETPEELAGWFMDVVTPLL